MISNSDTYSNRNKGFSLVELLIAMALGVILVAGMLTVFSGNRRSSELNNEMANMQENARFALNQISQDARMGGFQGCPDINSAAARVLAVNAPTVGGTTYRLATSGSVVTAANQWTPNPPPTFNIPADNAAIPGTHTLTLQYGDPDTETLLVPMVNQNAPIVIGDNPWNAQVGDLMIISDCQTADLFRITGLASAGPITTIFHNATATGNVQQTLSSAYGQSTTGTPSVMPFRSEIYYVGDTGQQNDAGDNIKALYQQSLPYTGAPIELVQGVENMRIRYGVRGDSGQLSYRIAGDPQLDPGRVESIQIGLLMTSYDLITGQDDEQTYVLAGQEIPPTEGLSDGTNHAVDRRFRLAFNTTVQIRNRRSETTF